MNNTVTGHEALEPDRARIERTLARYPHIDPGEVRDLVNWFRKEASAHDVAMVACNERIREQYARFRRDHIDRFTVKEVMLTLAFFAAAAIIVGIVWAMPG